MQYMAASLRISYREKWLHAYWGYSLKMIFYFLMQVLLIEFSKSGICMDLWMEENRNKSQILFVFLHASESYECCSKTYINITYGILRHIMTPLESKLNTDSFLLFLNMSKQPAKCIKLINIEQTNPTLWISTI